MPALVNSNVGSLAGKSGEERTRVCPCRSKYSKNFSRISDPVIRFESLACWIQLQNRCRQAQRFKRKGRKVLRKWRRKSFFAFLCEFPGALLKGSVVGFLFGNVRLHCGAHFFRNQFIRKTLAQQMIE